MWKIAGLLICVATFAAGSCGGSASTNKAVEQRTQVITSHPWVYDMEEISARTSFDSLTTQERNMVLGVMNNLQGAIFGFRPDSSFTIVIGPGDTIFGHWSFNQDATEIMMQPTPVKVQFQPIEEFGEDKIVLGIDRSRGFIFPRVLVPAGDSIQ